MQSDYATSCVTLRSCDFQKNVFFVFRMEKVWLVFKGRQLVTGIGVATPPSNAPLVTSFPVRRYAFKLKEATALEKASLNPYAQMKTVGESEVEVYPS